MTDYRARFDAVIAFREGGGLCVRDFELDVPTCDPSEHVVGELLISCLALASSATVTVRRLRVRASDPSDPRPLAPADVWSLHPGRRIIELNHAGTNLTAPWGRGPAGAELTAPPLRSTVDLPAIVVSTVAGTAGRLDALALSALDPAALHGSALLLRTGRSALTGRPGYVDGSGFLTRDGAQLLALCGVALVGIDSVSIDDVQDVERPASTVLLAEGIPVVADLIELGRLPSYGARFTAVPPRIASSGTFPVRAFATVAP